MSMVYTTDLDYTIVDKPNLSDDELLSYIRSNFYTSSPGKWDLPSVYKFVKLLCRMESVEPSVEQFIYILCNSPRLLNEACAGAGKTTMSKYKMALANICYNIPGKNILAIAYNTHAAKDIDKKYKVMSRRLDEYAKGRIHLDTDIVSKTMHSWCLLWVEEYKSRWKIRNIDLMDENTEIQFMQKAITGYLKNTDNKDMIVSDTMVQNMIQLNNWIRETLTLEDPQEWYLCSARTDLNMFSAVDIVSIIERYRKAKLLLNKQDYQDLVQFMYELVTDPEILDRMRRVYKYIVVDEYQDITPSMLRIFKVFMEGEPVLGIPRFDEGTLVCIGDGDQSIYGFRGTDSDNCIRFREDYPGAKITAMSINRRCDNLILDYARKIIESNPNRIIKPIRGLHSGGSLEIKNYVGEVDEIGQLITELRKIPNLRRTCICYRNLISSQFIVVKLLEAGIPMNIVRGIEPFTDIFSKSINDILDLFEHPNVPQYAERVLYKYIPRGNGFTKDNLRKIFKKHEDELKMSRKGNFVEAKNFWELDYGAWHTQKGFTQALDSLRKACIALKHNQSMSVFMPGVITQLRKYYIDSLRKNLFSDKLSDEYIKFIERYYTQDTYYSVFKKDRSKLFEDLQTNKSDGVYLTTMHGLKGLEFDTVLVVDMDDNLYPGNELKNKNFSEEQRTKIEWEARRLLYVTITRAKHAIKLFFNSNCPSRYIKFFMDNDDLTELYNQAQRMSSSDYNVLSGSVIQEIADNYKDDEFIFEDDIGSSIIREYNKEPEVSNKKESFSNLEGYDDLYSALFDEDENDKPLESMESNPELLTATSEDDVPFNSNPDDVPFDINSDFDDLRDEPAEDAQDKIDNKSKDIEKSVLPWLENPDSICYKPKLTAMIDLIRSKNKDNGE